MSSPEIRRREENERRAFSQIGLDGRSSATDDAALLLPDATIARYAARLHGERAPRTPLEQMFAFLGPTLEGQRVLEICCHTCEFGAILARLGADVVSVDIAEPLIAVAQRRARVNGVAEHLHPLVMSVHEMGFPDESFDVVFGKAALHHLDLDAARDEIHRVLRPGGIAVFSEPVSFSPWLAAIREHVPIEPNRESPDERPLTRGELDRFCRPFRQRREVYFRLFSRLDRLSERSTIALSALDRALLEHVPLLRRAAGQVAFAVTR